MARSVADLELALGILMGPDEDEANGYRVDLPPPRRERLEDFRVLAITRHPLAVVDSEISAALERLIGGLEAEGGLVARESELLPDLVAAHGLYLGLLQTVMSRGGPPPASLPDAHAWLGMLDGQQAIRRRWRRLFEDFDVVIAPTFGVPAFPHDTADFESRTHVIDGVVTPYGAQLAWPGMATLANLPATAAPIGATRAGLPIGLQIIGPAYGDRTTLQFARLIAGL
jgi:amidase